MSHPWASACQGEQQSGTELMALMADLGEGGTSAVVSAKNSPEAVRIPPLNCTIPAASLRPQKFMIFCPTFGLGAHTQPLWAAQDVGTSLQGGTERGGGYKVQV